MNVIESIASAKAVSWKTLANAIDLNFTELQSLIQTVNNLILNKLDKTEANNKFLIKGNYATIELLSTKLDKNIYELDKPKFETKSNAVQSYQPKGEYANKVVQLNITGTSITLELLPNKFYLFQEVLSLTLTLANPIEGIYNEYMLLFTSGNTPTTLNLPESIKWIGSNLIQSNKTYQISIVNNIAIMGGI